MIINCICFYFFERAEESFLKLSSETSKCCSALKEIQSIEEKLLKVLSESNISHYSYYIQEVLDEYTSAVTAVSSLLQFLPLAMREYINGIFFSHCMLIKKHK